MSEEQKVTQSIENNMESQIVGDAVDSHEMANLVWASDESMEFHQSDFEALSSKRADDIQNFDDAGVAIGSLVNLDIGIRTQRDTAPTLVPLDNFEIVPGLNPRLPTPEWHAHIRWLADEMKANGYRKDKPIYGFITGTNTQKGSNRVAIIDGESRYEAAKLAASEGADIKILPTVFAPDGLSIEEMAIQLASSNSGKPFTPIEMAYLAQRITRWGHPPVEVARILKVTTSYVTQLLSIAKAPNKIRTMIRDGAVSMQVALSALKDGPQQAVTQLEDMVNKAKESGRDRVTAKFLPEHQRQKAARTYAPQMQNLLNKLKSNEGIFQILDDDLREEIEKLLSGIEEMSTRDPAEIAKAKSDKKAEAQAKRDARKEKQASAAAMKEAKAKAKKEKAEAKLVKKEKTSKTKFVPADSEVLKAAKAKAEKALAVAKGGQEVVTRDDDVIVEREESAQVFPD